MHTDLIPEVNYTGDSGSNGNSRVYPSPYNPTQPKIGGSGASFPTLSSGSTPGRDQGSNPGGPSKSTVFVPSPVSSNKGSNTMYNMDQMTNNIAIPKHTLPNPSNLATSRSTIATDGEQPYGQDSSDYNHHSPSGPGGGSYDDRESHHDRYSSSLGGPRSSNHLLDEYPHRGEQGGNSFMYDEEDSVHHHNHHGSDDLNDAQEKRGGWRGEMGGDGTNQNGDSQSSEHGMSCLSTVIYLDNVMVGLLDHFLPMHGW